MCYLCLKREILGKSIITLEENSLFTKGNNPWIDGITYNGKWGESSLVPTEVNINIIKPKDQKVYDLNKLAWYQAGLSGDQWIDDGNPIGKIDKNHRQSIKAGYKAWSDVANLDFNFIENPMEAGVLVTFAKYANKGIDDGGILLGSHRGLLVDQNIIEVDIQEGQQIGVEYVIGSNPAPSPTPLLLDLNYDYFSKIDAADPQFLETIIHEVGHGIGMSHPHDRGLGSVPSGIFPGLQDGDAFASTGTGLYGLNQNVYTIMSYNDLDFTNIDPDQIHAVTPMALELLASQIKYGPNLSTRSGDDTYRLLDRTKPDRKAWASIWDAGGNDTISAKGMNFGVEISLRAAEMNAQRPETGMPQEQYYWPSPWSKYQIALDFLVNTESSQPGALLGSGIKKSFTYATILDELTGLDTYYKQDYSDQMIDGLRTLSDALTILYEAYGFIGTHSIIKGKEKIPTDIPDSVEQALDNGDKGYEKAIDIFETLEYNIKEYIDSSKLSSLSIEDYYQNISDAEKLQSDVQLRSAKGVAGYISKVRNSEVSSLAVDDRPGGGFTIAAGVTIENAVGGQGNDVITGNVADNSIRSLAGDDFINPYLGSNKIQGGKGIDTVNFDSEVGSWRRSELSFEQGNRWLKVTMGDSGDINHLRNVEFLIIEGEQYGVDSLI